MIRHVLGIFGLALKSELDTAVADRYHLRLLIGRYEEKLAKLRDELEHAQPLRDSHGRFVSNHHE